MAVGPGDKAFPCCTRCMETRRTHDVHEEVNGRRVDVVFRH